MNKIKVKTTKYKR